MKTIITGQVFGRLTALYLHHIKPNSVKYWLCRCRCGNEVIVNARSLKYGVIKSCGCLVEERRQAKRKDFTQRFWSKVANYKSDSCWDWLGNVGKSGHGTVSYKGKSSLSHRVAWIISVGPVPKNLYVMHSCGNPLCCNPYHMYLSRCSRKSRKAYP